eukprot:3769448-Rhodomonas_salina.3
MAELTGDEKLDEEWCARYQVHQRADREGVRAASAPRRLELRAVEVRLRDGPEPCEVLEDEDTGGHCFEAIKPRRVGRMWILH